MLVIVDKNEKATSPTTVDLLQTKFPDLILGDLDYGDVQIILDDGKRLAIERKSVHDLLASIADGRLFSQVERMAQADYSIVIVVGTLSYTVDDMAVANGEKTNWNGASVRGALYAVQFSGCPVLYSNERWYPILIEGIANFVAKPNQHWQQKHRRIITFPPLDDRVDLLASFAGIGVKRATSLLEFAGKDGELGTLSAALAWACALELINVGSRPAGWGKKMIENVRLAMGLKSGQYLEIKESEATE